MLFTSRERAEVLVWETEMTKWPGEKFRQHFNSLYVGYPSLDLIASVLQKHLSQVNKPLVTPEFIETERLYGRTGYWTLKHSPLERKMKGEVTTFRLEKMPADLPGPRAGEVYRHYKGGLYEVVGVGIVVGSRYHWVVTYRDHGKPEAGGLSYTRNLFVYDDMLRKEPWLSYVYDGRPRFKLVENPETEGQE